MKNQVRILLLLLSFSLLFAPAFADILPPNSHYVERCVKISNLEQYPSIVIITQDLYIGGNEQTLSIAAAGQCLNAQSYKFNQYKIYWAERSYVDSIQLQNLSTKNASYGASSIDDVNIHFITSSISTSGGYEDNSNPATSEEVSYTLEVNPSGGYNLVKAGAPSAPSKPAEPSSPSTPSKPAQIPPTPPPSVDGTSAVLYMLLVLVLGASAIFIIIKSMAHSHPKSMPPAREEPAESASEAPYAGARPSSEPRSRPATRKKKA